MSNEYSLGGTAAAINEEAARLAESRVAGATAANTHHSSTNLNQAVNSFNPATNNATRSWMDETVDLPVTQTTSSEAVSKLEMVLPELLKKVSQDHREVRILGVDNTVEPQWRYSSAIVAVLFKNEKSVAFYPLLLEQTCSAPLTEEYVRLSNESDQSIPVLPTASLAMDAAYQQRMKEEIERAFPIKDLRVLYVPGMILFNNFDFENTEALKHVVFSAVKAATMQMAEITPGFDDVNLAAIQSKQVKLRIDIAPNNPDKIDVARNPVRAPITLRLTDSAPTQANQANQMQRAHTLNGSGASEVLIGTVGAYLDARLLPPDPAVNYGGMNQNPLARTRRFIPELVITSVDLPRTATSAAMLLMISQAAVVAAPRLLVSLQYQMLRAGFAQYKGAPWNPTDIGYLDLISNTLNEQTPAPLDLESATTTPVDFLNFQNAVFAPGVAISIDVPRMGPQSSFLSTLTAAANNETIGLQFLQSSADRYSGGRFSQLFFNRQVGDTSPVPLLQRQDVFAEFNNTVYLGHYPVRQGDKTVTQDLRHIDLTATAARFGTTDPNMLNKLAQSYMVNNIAAPVRMANRREVINAYTGDSATIQDLADRHTFTTKFIQTLALCNIANRFEPVAVYNDPLANAASGLHAPGFIGTGLLMDAVQGSFQMGVQSGSGIQQGGAAFNPVGGGRFYG